MEFMDGVLFGALYPPTYLLLSITTMIKKYQLQGIIIHFFIHTIMW